MKRITHLLILALMVSGLSLSACERDEETVTEPAEPTEPEVPEEPEVAEEEEEEEEEEAREYSVDTFIPAAFEVRCVEAHVEEEEQAATIKTEIFARYGFEGQEDFDAAQAQLGELETVQTAVNQRMENCTEELALGFQEAGYDPDAAEEEAVEEAQEEQQARPAAPPRPEPARTGQMQGSITGSDFSDARLEIQVRQDFQIRGTFRGEREGRAFMVNFSGTVGQDGSINISGERGGNTVNMTGRLTAAGATGELSGRVHQRDYRVRYNVN